ncbi:hypothetical protein DVU_3083 [Nitratidesulfovibrio vulgaris str. Hildenborough]|uniref:Uncharacterized protein n=1 Tax=Nitratidesulfovibrio vulgaris (strain ATCC 29579 / DSM 644 / CCUG 34227 / NCIMB 8303 / VKM B-1760 / Hildenborough) TaxID=882 RepID=Q726M3_NITV2|nr:hypothetical protein DVU_3083 [Nitratidesulfovibrio vulgaris str. Hildenborough]
MPPPLRKIVVSTQNTMRAYPMQKARAFARASINRSSPDIPQHFFHEGKRATLQRLRLH